MCLACYDSLQSYLKFATNCLDWEDKLQKYVKMVGLRKKRKFCLDNFLQKVDKLGHIKNGTTSQETFKIESNEIEINIKHEITEVEDR